MTTNEAVIAAFGRGDAKQANSLASIPVKNGHAILVGYGHAVYAVRDATGEVTRFDGWKGRSATTTKHVNLVEDPEYTKDLRPTTEETIKLLDPKQFLTEQLTKST